MFSKVFFQLSSTEAAHRNDDEQQVISEGTLHNSKDTHKPQTKSLKGKVLYFSVKDVVTLDRVKSDCKLLGAVCFLMLFIFSFTKNLNFFLIALVTKLIVFYVSR
jgi:hypothetical protein